MDNWAKQAGGWLLIAALGAPLFGCGKEATPAPAPQAQVRSTQDTRAEEGMESYGGYRPPAEDRQIVTDPRNSAVRQNSRRPFSAHGMAYELESMEAVKGAMVIISGQDAYVGIRSAEGYLPADVPSRVVEKIRKMDKTVQRVYITDDAQAVEYLSGYSQALEQGLPLQSYESRFQDVVKNTAWMRGF